MLKLFKEKIGTGKIKDFTIEIRDEEIYGFLFEDGTRLIFNFSYPILTFNWHFSVHLGLNKVYDSINPFKKFFFRNFVRKKIRELFKNELKLNETK